MTFQANVHGKVVCAPLCRRHGSARRKTSVLQTQNIGFQTKLFREHPVPSELVENQTTGGAHEIGSSAPEAESQLSAPAQRLAIHTERDLFLCFGGGEGQFQG